MNPEVCREMCERGEDVATVNDKGEEGVVGPKRSFTDSLKLGRCKLRWEDGGGKPLDIDASCI